MSESDEGVSFAAMRQNAGRFVNFVLSDRTAGFQREVARRHGLRQRDGRIGQRLLASASQEAAAIAGV